MNKNDFESFVRAIIAEHPDWVDSAIRGIAAGQSAALNRARQDAGEARNAMVLALILANRRRGKLSDHMLDQISSQIIKVIGTPSCGAEDDFINEHSAKTS